VTARLVILLPPSEGKAPNEATARLSGSWDCTSGRFGGQAGPARQRIAEALVSIGGGDAALLGARGALLDRAQRANTSLIGAPTMPAWRRYVGVVHEHLDIASMEPSQRRRAHESVVVVSGLLGVVALDDQIPDYRLKMSARLPEVGPLARFWKPLVSDAIARLARRRTVIDLLPGEHGAAYEPTGKVMRITFADDRGRTVGHDAKAAKGRFARHLLTSDDSVDEAIASFVDDRYRLEVHR
jgi:uncharacterized protein